MRGIFLILNFQLLVYLTQINLVLLLTCLVQLISLHRLALPFYQLQKQPSRGVFRKRCSENMQQIYSRTPMPKCDFKIALRQGCSPVNLQHIGRIRVNMQLQLMCKIFYFLCMCRHMCSGESLFRNTERNFQKKTVITLVFKLKILVAATNLTLVEVFKSNFMLFMS